MKYLWAEWDKVKEIIFEKRTKLIFLDFDGTLAPIAQTPQAVRFDPQARKVLKELSKNRHIHPVIISGRRLKELKSYIRLSGIILAGNHGLEMQGRGSVRLPVKAKQARKLKDFIHILSQKFKMAFDCYPGVMVEDKQYTLSVHFRNLPRGQINVFKQLVRFFKEKYKHYPVVWTLGKKVVEIRPSIYWGKADTVNRLLEEYPKAVSIAIGDDKADEDMFKMVKKHRGISIRVGYSRASLADYYLSSPYDVKVFLKKLCP